MKGALAQLAEEIYDGLSDESKSLARQVFLRLVTLGEGIEDTRRRVPHSELSAIQTSEVSKALPGPTSQVLDSYSQARLLTFDRDPATREPTVEVAHEALLREWERLRNWLDESRDDVRWARPRPNG